jgi:hydrogenase maturation protease
VTGPRILVAGIGNIFFGDDGFGVAVAQRLAARALPERVRVMDVGIRGLDLAYALLDGYDATILVDVTRRGGPPGTLYVLEPTLDPAARTSLETHSLDPATVLALVRSLGGDLGCLRLVGCEPARLGDGEDGDAEMGLSAPVAAAVEPAVALVESLVDVLSRAEPRHA